MFPIYEISAAPHLPYALRRVCEIRETNAEVDSVETEAARELLADGIIIAAIAVNWN